VEFRQTMSDGGGGIKGGFVMKKMGSDLIEIS